MDVDSVHGDTDSVTERKKKTLSEYCQTDYVFQSMDKNTIGCLFWISDLYFSLNIGCVLGEEIWYTALKRP